MFLSCLFLQMGHRRKGASSRYLNSLLTLPKPRDGRHRYLELSRGFLTDTATKLCMKIFKLYAITRKADGVFKIGLRVDLNHTR